MPLLNAVSSTVSANYSAFQLSNLSTLGTLFPEPLDLTLKSATTPVVFGQPGFILTTPTHLSPIPRLRTLEIPQLHLGHISMFNPAMCARTVGETDTMFRGFVGAVHTACGGTLERLVLGILDLYLSKKELGSGLKQPPKPVLAGAFSPFVGGWPKLQTLALDGVMITRTSKPTEEELRAFSAIEAPELRQFWYGVQEQVEVAALGVMIRGEETGQPWKNCEARQIVGGGFGLFGFRRMGGGAWERACVMRTRDDRAK